MAASYGKWNSSRYKAKVWDRCILKLFGESLKSCPKILVDLCDICLPKTLPSINFCLIFNPPKKKSLKEIKISSRKIIKILEFLWGSTMHPEEGFSFIRRPEAEWADAKFQAAFWGCNENVKILPVEKRLEDCLMFWTTWGKHKGQNRSNDFDDKQ